MRVSECIMNDFQKRLQELLTEHDLSRLQLSKKIGISFETLNGYFNKDFYPEISVAVKISNYFDCSLDYLMGLDDNPNNQDNNLKTFAENLKCLLKENNLSPEKLMHKLNMSEANYYRWQRGTKPAMTSLIQIAKFFNVSIDFLAGDFK